MTRISCLTLFVMFAPLVLEAQAPIERTRTPTCVQGLREYRNPADVPVPYDTVIPQLTGGIESGGLMQIAGVDEFFTAVFKAAAALGATGYISYSGSGEANGRRSMGRVLPVFV